MPGLPATRLLLAEPWAGLFDALSAPAWLGEP